jgi:hypothetical protein
MGVDERGEGNLGGGAEDDKRVIHEKTRKSGRKENSRQGAKAQRGRRGRVFWTG